MLKHNWGLGCADFGGYCTFLDDFAGELSAMAARSKLDGRAGAVYPP